MPSLESVIAGIPGLAGYTAQKQMLEGQGQQGLAQAGTLMKMQKMIAEQQKEAAFRQELAAARTDEERAAVAMKYGGPNQIMADQTRRAQIGATKEATMARLQQSAQQFQMQHEMRLRSAASAEERAAEIARHNKVMEGLSSYAQRVAGERLQYDTGVQLPPPAMPAGAQPLPGPAAQPAPVSAPPAAAPASPPMLNMQGVPEDAATKAAIGMMGTGQPVRMDLGILPSQHPDAANLDARDLLARAQPLPEPPAPLAPPPVVPRDEQELPAWITNIKSQKERTAAEKAWRLQRGQGGGRPMTPFGKLNEDLKTGAITQDQYDSELKRLSSGAKASDDLVNAIAQGRMAMPSGFALRSPYWQDVIERVAKVNPSFDAGVFTARSAARRAFASGPEARNVTAMNTLIGHLGTLDEAAQALENKDLRAYNAVQNRLRLELGDPRIQNFETAKEAVANEAMRVFRVVGASTSEIEAFRQKITSSGSPAQLRASISQIGTLLESRIEAMQQQFDRTVNQTGNPATVDPKNQSVLDRLRGQPAASPQGTRGGATVSNW